ncbi:DUF418 domain-containing protein [Nocardioides speluncae]|uniref:DUF418 domain-containing protein n=1 Tax=Nocardioides speluncae TaxID=2670337 RepID=UPI000D697DE1|nr:DUF418 domain-containing protein [Nocardioides speluncae]
MTTDSAPTTSQQAGPVALSARALGPDLARGFMLLFIALANSHYFLRGDSYRGGFPVGGSGLDSAVTWATSTFVDGRAFPMFGLLFGYGVAHIVRRNEDLGRWPLRKLLWRRSLVLIVVGFLHCMLLYTGDILAAYGMLLLLGAWAVRWKDRWLFVVAALFFLLACFPAIDGATIDTAGPDQAMLSPDLLTQLGERIVVQPLIMFLGPIGFACPFLIGLWAGRRKILERPEQYAVLLRWVAAIGIGAAVIGAQPAALLAAGAASAPSDDALSWFSPMHDATGILGGFGYAALIALVAGRLSRQPDGERGWLVTAIAATGQRSMTCYLAQSVVWALVFTPYLLDLSDDLSVTANALLAASTWFGTVLLADLMHRRDYRGPFELLVRKVTYRR